MTAPPSSAAIQLDDAVTRLHGVGPAVATHLDKLGIGTVRDVLLHLPSRYQDRTRLTPIRRLEASCEALVMGEVMDSRETFGKRRSWLIIVGDGSGFLTLRFFHFNRRQQQQLKPGQRLCCFGEARLGPNGLEMVHPEYRLLEASANPVEESLTPVYPATEGISQTRLQRLTEQALRLLDSDDWPDTSSLLRETDEGALFPRTIDALRVLHRPPAGTGEDLLATARARLALEEMGVHVMVARRAKHLRRGEPAEPLPRGPQLGRALLELLGFELTRAQRRVVREVLGDMERSTPMLRLVQGDVGSGKTVIAAFAAIRAAEHGRQTAIMAPTEILAEQHYLNFSTWLEPLGISICLLTGKLSAKERRDRAARIASGEALVAIGTHALFQNDVAFDRLALTIVDEQHRFGVHQRMALRAKGPLPHQLVMTATPIPRTLTMTLYADMDVSLLDELPPGRSPIETRAIDNARRAEVVERLGTHCRHGGQAYWVCTLIEESEHLDASAAETTAAELQSLLPDVAVALLHGRMTAASKARIMDEFKRGRVQLLVATTVIEVGVDVPDASLIVIENPERLGLAQLHQLRGRVGRGVTQSYCLLLYQAPLGRLGRARLNVMRASTDGFVIAEKDLWLRGPGDLLGTRQTGERQFRVAELAEHAHLVPRAVAFADAFAGDAERYHALITCWAVKAGEYHHV